MIILRNQLLQLNSIFNKILNNSRINIYTQYKFLKLKKIYDEELDIYQQQLNKILQYCDKTNENDNMLKIKTEYVEQCKDDIQTINSIVTQLPDIYFSLDELENLQLTFAELEILMPFIKE